MTARMPTIWCITWAMAGAASAADSAPTLGSAHNTKDLSSVDYECVPESGGALSCDFVQIRVQPEATAADLTNAVTQAYKEEDKALGEETCKDAAAYVAGAEGRVPMPKRFILPKSEMQKRDYLRTMKAAVAFCEKPTNENMEAFVRTSMEPQTRTCLVSVHKFSQKFTLVSDPTTGKKTWVVKAAPSGPCGTVQLDRFESAQPWGAEGLTIWNYIARKAITNPKGEKFGLSCSKLDESTYFYSGNQADATREARCEYVKFSPL